MLLLADAEDVLLLRDGEGFGETGVPLAGGEAEARFVRVERVAGAEPALGAQVG